MSASTIIKSTCPYCGVGCGVSSEIGQDGLSVIRVIGDEANPANSGKLCVKGSRLAESQPDMEGELHPLISGIESTWDAATTLVAQKLTDTVSQYGPDSVAFYLSGQLLTEDYYVANKLMKGFIGSSNVDTNSRLCMASAVAAHQRAFGEDVVPVNYDDLDVADLVILVGSNAAWTHPVLYQRMKSAKLRGTKFVVIDPRETATCDLAHLHLKIAPGSDVALFNGLLCFFAAGGLLDEDFIGQHTTGFRETLAQSRRSNVTEATGLSQTQLEQFYCW